MNGFCEKKMDGYFIQHDFRGNIKFIKINVKLNAGLV